jgi:hypothetical protein
MAIYFKGSVNGLSKGFGRRDIMNTNGDPNGIASAVPGDVAYDSDNDLYFENTTASVWAART